MRRTFTLLALASLVIATPPSLAEEQAIYRCTVYGNTTTDDGVVVDVASNGPTTRFGKSDRGRGPWSLALETVNVEGISLIELSLLTPRQNASIATSRATPGTPAIGLTVTQGSIVTDIVCQRR